MDDQLSNDYFELMFSILTFMLLLRERISHVANRLSAYPSLLQGGLLLISISFSKGGFLRELLLEIFDLYS